MKCALLFGINYIHQSDANMRLSGCVNDVNNMASYLKSLGDFDYVYTATDENKHSRSTSKFGIIRKLYTLAIKSHYKSIDLVYLHFSGHGASLLDRSGDERDGKDEVFVPSDYDTRGVIYDDTFRYLFKRFHPDTKVVCVFDCCHSGTMGDLPYQWYPSRNSTSSFYHIQNNYRLDLQDSQIIIISGCKDNQYSADAYNVQGKFTFTGALTSCLLLTFEHLKNNNLSCSVFNLLTHTRNLLKEKNFEQIPQLTSSYIIKENDHFL